jgi:pyruvate,water dikinase
MMMLGERHGNNKVKMKMNMRIIKVLPKFIIFTLKNVMISKRINKFLFSQKRLIDFYDNADITDLSTQQTQDRLSEIERLCEDCAYNVIIVRLVRSFHHRVLISLLQRKGIDKQIQFRLSDLKDVDPQANLADLKKAYERLPYEDRERLEKSTDIPNSKIPCDFEMKYRLFLKRFGHLSSSTVDMSKPQWKEKPEFIINLIKNYSQPKSISSNSETTSEGSGWLIANFYKNFVDYEKLSLRMSYIYSYGYSLFRKYFLHLGSIFENKGIIEKAEDIFYLYKEEVQQIITYKKTQLNYRNFIERRKNQISEYSDIILPEVIYGDITPPPIKKSMKINRLRGLPTSRGYYEGPAKIVMGPTDFDRILPGDIIVIPFSDSSWTVVFSKVGAVVSESGGLLSHCSIIAREYGLPAVVAVEGALGILDNNRVIVNGYTGEVIVVNEKIN